MAIGASDVYTNELRRALNFLGFTASGALENGAQLVELVGFSPKDSPIVISPNVTIQGTNNLFQHTAFDGAGAAIKSPNLLNGAVTKDVETRTVWQNKGIAPAGPGDQVEIVVTIVQVDLIEGNVLGTLPELTITNTHDMEAVEPEELFLIPITIPAGALVGSPDTVFVISITRDARVGNINDTHDSDIALVSIQIIDDVLV